MNIAELPISDICRVTVFNDRRDYSLSKSGDVLESRDSYAMDFLNRREKFNAHKLYKLSKLTDEIIKKLYTIAKQPVITLPEFLDYVISNTYNIPVNENTWFIFPNPSKANLSGKIHKIEFKLGHPEFGYGGDLVEELDVYITPITKKSKSVKFSMFIPEFLYDKCMTCADTNERPEKDYLESDSLSGLHHNIDSLVSLAHKVWRHEEDAKKAKKVICINFNSTESTTRDDWNHGYTGQRISTTFQFFVAYKTDSNKYFTFDKLHSGFGTTDKGIKGIVNTEQSGERQNLGGKIPNVVLDWTQEKEDYLKKLENQFRLLSNELNEFLSDLNDDKLMLLINSNTKLLN